jgi:hypothetical protein
VKTSRIKPWLCQRCGYMMDAHSPIDDGEGSPEDGDAAICLNCGAPYEMRSGKWAALNAHEFEALDPQLRQDLLRAQISRIVIGIPDLTKRDRNA